MGMTNNQTAVPHYLKQFSCIGSSCEDTCCAWWGISIDKQSYNRYQTVNHSGMRNKLNDHLTVKKNGSAQDYAEMQLNPETGNCSMLDGGLCTIQATLGEEYLSQTCRTYPRVVNQAGAATEMSLQLSCPEAARVILLDRQAMDFEEASPGDPGILAFRHVTSSGHNEKKRDYYLPQIRGMMMEIIRYRQFSLPHRLILLGVFCDNVNLIMEEKKFRDIPAFLLEFRHEAAHNEELLDYNVFPVDPAFQLQYLNNCLMGVLEDTLWNTRYRECMNDYTRGMKATDASLESILDVYTESYEQYTAPFLDSNPQILENYILNAIYSRVLGEMSQGIPVFDCYRMLILDFAMIKLHLIGMASYHKELSRELAVKLIQSYTKNYEHASLFHKKILDDLRKKDYASLGYMCLFIKN